MKYIATLKEDSEILLNGDRCITSMHDLYKVLLLPDTTEIVLTSEFVERYYTLSGVKAFIESASQVNSNVLINTEEIDASLQLDQVEQLASLRTREDLMNALVLRENDILSTIQDLCKYYKDTIQENVAANNKVATLHLLNSQLENKLRERNEDYDKLMVVRNDLEAKLKTLISRVNYNYSKGIEPNKIAQVTGHRYDRLLYIKEVTRIHFTDTMIQYLQEILKITYGVPCRLVVIEPEYAYARCAMYPKCKPYYDLTKQDVFQSDIVMAGMQYRLLEDIIHNPAHVNYLIILDRSGYTVPHVYGANIELLYTVSDLGDLDKLEIEAEPDHIISYDEQTLNIPYVSGFHMMSLEERMRTYSSMPIIQSLLDILERR